MFFYFIYLFNFVIIQTIKIMKKNMKSIIPLLVMFIMGVFFAGCEDKDEIYSFQYENFTGTVIYPDGVEFKINAMQFMEERKCKIRITVPLSAIENEDDKFKYITAIDAEYVYTRNGNKDVSITLVKIATVTFGAMGGETKTIRTNNLQTLFPVNYELTFDRKNGNKDKINSNSVISDIKVFAEK